MDVNLGNCTAIFKFEPRYGTNEYRIKPGKKKCEQYFLTGNTEHPTRLTIEGKASDCTTTNGLDSVKLSSPFTQSWTCGKTEIFTDTNVKAPVFTSP